MTYIYSKLILFILSIVIGVFSVSPVFAAGLVIPASCTVDVTSCALIVPGDVTNAGTLRATTGTITVLGNWLNSGTFTSGTSTIVFNATSGTQTLNTGGLASAFYNVTHSGAGTVQLLTNQIDINNTFINSAGTFDANNLNMKVGKDWNNSATFTPGTATVSLDGDAQTIIGSTTFYNLSKIETSADTLTFTSNAGGTMETTVTNTLTLKGAIGQLLSIRETGAGAESKIKLNAAGTQDISYLDVQNSNATGLTLLAGTTSTNSGGNTNWSFGAATLTWDGSSSTDWDDPSNWDFGVVPAPGDSVIIPDVSAGSNRYPTLASISGAGVTIGTLTINANTTLTLAGKNLVLASTFSNSGNVILQGNETITLVMDTDSGTFTYVGDGSGASNNRTFTINGSTTVSFFNLVINDPNATPANRDVFVSANPITVNGNLTITDGTLNASASTLDVNGNISIAADGILIAPSGTTNTSFTVAGNWTNSGGTFTHSSGKVTFDAANGVTQTITGSNTFYQLRKVVTGATTFTLDAASVQTVQNDLTLSGAAGQELSLVTTAPPTQADLTLAPGGTQSLQFLNVNNIDASSSSGVLLVARSSTNTTPATNTNWSFGAVTVVWDGSASTSWGVQSNWDLGLVPTSADTVIVCSDNTATGCTGLAGAPANQPTFVADSSVTNLTINSGSTLTLNGFDLIVATTFSNDGTVVLTGASTEALTLTMDSNSGTFTYVGDGGGATTNHTLTINGSTTVSYFNLVINDPNATPANRDVYLTANPLVVNGSLTVTDGTLNGSASTIDVAGNVSIAADGVLIAPASTANTAFTVAGNWTNSGGTFTHSSGKVTLDGTNQSILGSTTFYQLRKSGAAAATLTLDDTGTQVISSDLTLVGGAAPNRLSIRSDNSPTAAAITLSAGGTQNISNVDVMDSNAGGGLALVARDDHNNSGNNTNWSFGAATLTWTGTTSTAWTTTTNWNLGVAPIAGDTVTIPDVSGSSGNFPVMSGAVSLANLTLSAAASTLRTAGNNLTVTSTVSNLGNILMFGNETFTVGTPDTDSGTITILGDGDGTAETNNLAANFVFTTSDNTVFNLVINDSNVTKDTVSAGGGAFTVNGNLTVTSSTFTAVSATALDVNGALSIAAGSTFIAPSATTATAFTLAGSFSNAGTFTHSNGRVTLDTTTTATFTGNSTFFSLYSSTAGKTINFTAGSNQTVANTVSLAGTTASPLVIQSTVPGTSWNITIPANQTVSSLSVRDSNALTNTITCFSCTNVSNNNANWIFVDLSITAPNTGEISGKTPTIVGQAPANTKVFIRGYDQTNTIAIVASTMSDDNGNFRVKVGEDDDGDAIADVAAGTELFVRVNNQLIPYILNASSVEVAGGQSTFEAKATTTPAEVPTITSPTANQRINGATPTVIGVAAAGSTITVQALDVNGNLADFGTGVADGSGNYSIALTTALPSGTNELSVLADSTIASNLVAVFLTDPFGRVFDSSSNQLIENAIVKIFRASDNQLAEASSCDALGNITTLRDLACTDTNPYTTAADGFYSFMAANANYYITVEATGYGYPTTLTTYPTGRTVTTGSKGEQFTVAGVVIEMDHPLDANGFLVRVEKSANKSEVRVGDVITYTVTMRNLSDNAVTGMLLEDRIPAGFKYLPNRVLLDGVPLAEPSGTRPLVFNIGSLAVGATKTLKYQLVVGSGVVPGTYENVARARYDSGIVMSNTSTKSVKVIADPLFDLGSVIGKVFYDLNENGIQDAPEYDPTEGTTIVEKPVPNVQIVTEDGTVVTVDREGKFSLPGLLPGRHILRLDERSLPPGTYLTTEKAVVIDVTQGAMIKVNFGVNADSALVTGKDAEFFNEKIALTQDRSKPVIRLNAALFSDTVDGQEELVMYNGTFVKKGEFRLFSNYSPFIDKWRLDIIDQDTKRLIKRFEGTRFNIHDPIIWDGRSNDDKFIRSDHNYSYILTAFDAQGRKDVTREKSLTIRVIDTEESYKKELEDDQEPETQKARAEKYRKWIDIQTAVNSLEKSDIKIEGETVRISRQGQDIKTLRVLKDGQLFAEVPVDEYFGLTPQEVLNGGADTSARPDNIEVVLPNGDYTLEVVGPAAAPGAPSAPQTQGGAIPILSPTIGPGPAKGPPVLGLERYSRQLKVGDDYMMFVGMGDAKVGYTFNRGNVESAQPDDKFNEGFWQEGKAAYYLKGKIKGKYLVTSSFDTDRQRKELFRKLDPDTYYPIYGDQSSVNYDATNTQGPLYLLVEWDKSQAIWGNYAVDFNDTEFAAFSRSYYGGKIDYQSVANNSYGDARTKAVVFHAEVKQRPAHNEFIGTGGSLYFLKHKGIIEGSDKVKLEVRDKITGLVLASKEMKNGSDYEFDESEGRILFYQPVSMIAKAESIVSNTLLDGNSVYVVTDYEYEVQDKVAESSQGVRLAQSVGDNVVVGGTYVQETQADKNYTLKGTDVTAHLGPDATVKAEIAETDSTGTSTYMSTDGGITFTELSTGNLEKGTAYGLSGDARLFNRLGLSSYYKYIDNTFASAATTSQQGKEMAGLALTFDVTPVTRLTARQDIQKLIQNGSLQTQAQVGAVETTTTLIQVVHEAERLTLTGAYQITQVKEKKDGFESTTNEEGKVLAGRADYALNGRVTLSAGQQFDINDPTKNVTTIGAEAKVTDTLTTRVQEAFSKEGTATTLGATANVTPNTAITTDYTVANKKTGEMDKTSSVGVSQKINDNLRTTANMAVTDSSTGDQTTTTSLTTTAKVADGTTVDAILGQTKSIGGEKTTASIGSTVNVDKDSALKTTVSVNDDSLAGQSKTLALDASRRVDDKTVSTSSVKVDENAQGGRTSSVAFADSTRINEEVRAVSERTFSLTPEGTKGDNKYALIRDKNGKTLEASVTRQSADDLNGVSQTNIFGLTGDVNDKLALQGSLEKGRVQNLDGSQTNRTAIALGAGYVWKDTETAMERLKNSTKIELRMDDGGSNARQFVFYNAIEGRINDNFSVLGKLDYSNTIDTETSEVLTRHKEIVLGGAYRPVNFDRLNLIGRYTYQENQGPSGQIQGTTEGVERNRMQVFAAEAIYDLNENWQIAEKFAYRINDEKVTGFEFNKTHTWLMVHRINYKMDRNWTISGEYRKLTQLEAKDSKQGLLLEATRNINDYAQLGVGWNFTHFSDDLTHLSFTSQGPFLRMTGKMYDRTPEEKARARAKWLDGRVSEWAWIMVKRELEKPTSKVVGELNRMFAMAQNAQKAGHYEQAQQIYKDVIMAGQMMFDEAAEYIRTQIAIEEKLQEYNTTAQEYYNTGEYLKARKLWEKVVEDAQKRVLQ
jgi:hypothetical protein